MPKQKSRRHVVKLFAAEETALSQQICQLAGRGFYPNTKHVVEMAQILVDKRGSKCNKQTVEKDLVLKFLERHPELKTKLSWPSSLRDDESEEDPWLAAREWFQRFQNFREKYGILDNDIYNVKKALFDIRMVECPDNGSSIATWSENCEWVVVMECINATGFTIPPFLALEDRTPLPELPEGWVVTFDPFACVDNGLLTQWVRHFDQSTCSRTVGNYRLVILDTHRTNFSPEFDRYCEQNNIITLFLPFHLSSLLQPVEIACFNPLKVVLHRQTVNSIVQADREGFLKKYQSFRPLSLSQVNITNAFRHTGLVSFDPMPVFSTILRSRPNLIRPMLYETANLTWPSGTPQHIVQLGKAIELARDNARQLSQHPCDQVVLAAKIAENISDSALKLLQENLDLRAEHQRLLRGLEG